MLEAPIIIIDEKVKYDCPKFKVECIYVGLNIY